VRPRVDAAEHVHPAQFIEYPREPLALLWQKTRSFPVPAPVPEIDFLVGDVPVAAHYELPAVFDQPGEMRMKLLHEAELRLLAMFSARTRRQIDRNHGELPEVGAQITSFGIEFANAESRNHTVRLAPGINADSAVAFLFGVMKVTAKAPRREHIRGHILGLRLQFLHADDIGLLAREPAKDVLTRRRTNAVEVHSDYA